MLTGLSEPGADAPETLEWRVHLAARQPGRAVLAVALAVVVGAWALYLFGSPGTAVAATGLLIGAIGEFLFPVTYRLTPEGAEARNPFYWRKIAWGEVRRVYSGPEAVKLSPLPYGGPREAFRGVVLRCEENREAVLAAVERYRDAAAAP